MYIVCTFNSTLNEHGMYIKCTFNITCYVHCMYICQNTPDDKNTPDDTFVAINWLLPD